ncbi:hypothetical protein JQC67_17970 [Aurantibacter crassamenti]|uniref:hypothetical protein n=1 Tax=Aurantibacter crassamenti TaxID=1837375 RepID=UPI00193A4D3C|nr:hypothetical protein [Aurantibacter crassamenti]MBM1108044.1 hypothetical protein [Aurantibacter crassamenti]
MRKLVSYFLLATIVLYSQNIVAQDQNILEKVANAHGFENWSKVKEIKFTFNVDSDGTHSERTWVWLTKTNDVTATIDGETLDYNRASMDSTAYKVNGRFINDKFWLLAPFQLVWDRNNITHKHTVKSTAPIAKKPMQKLTIVYGNEGGYTPGDAYDFYFEDDYVIKEWVFRRANQPEPSMITTFEDYENINGLKIAKSHKKADADFNLNFTGLSVN